MHVLLSVNDNCDDDRFFKNYFSNLSRFDDTPEWKKKNIIDGMQNPLGTSRSDQMKTVYCWWDENCRYQLIEWKSLLDENYSGFLLNEQDCMLGGGGDVICCTRRFLHPLLSLSFYFRKEETQSWRRKPRIEEGGPKRLLQHFFGSLF